MSEELEARHIVNDGETISTIKVPDRDVLRDMDLCGRCVCDCRECIMHDVHQHGRDAARAECEADCGMSTGAAASSSPTTSTARRQANLQYTNLCFRQSTHRPCTSKHIKKRKLRKPPLTINPKVKNNTKQITTKYLQKFKRFISIQNPDAKRDLFKNNRKINQLSSLMENYPRRIKKYNLGGTRARLGLVNSIKVPVSSSNTTSTVHSRKRQESHYNRTKLIASNLFSKLMFYLKPFFVMKRKSQTTKKSNRKKKTCYEPPAVTLNYIFPHQRNSSHTLDGIKKMKWGKQSSVLNAASDMSSIPNSSIQSFNDQETQVSEHSAVQHPIVNGEPFVTNLSVCNVYSQCMLRQNNLLIPHINKNGKMIIKKSRRVMFRGHHNRFMTRTYRQNFNKTYHTFLAEINYTNQPLQSCQNRQGVGIGSTWDVCIDFGRCQVLPGQGGAGLGSGTFRCTPSVCVTSRCDPNKCYKRLKKQKGNVGQGSRSKPYQCPPGDCVAGACNSNECFKRLNKTAPYGSHVSTQSHKNKLKDRKAVRDKTYGRKKVNMTSCRKIRKRDDSRLAENQMAFTPAGLPCRQSVRIGSKCSFNVKLYKVTALGTRSGQNYQGHTTVRRKAGRVRKKKKPLKPFQCEPGICVPGKCTPSECLKQFECKPKICRPGKCDPSDCYRRQRGTATETSLPCSSNGSSQVSTQSSRLKGRELRAGRETFCKEKGVLSKPRSKLQLNMPYRQAVRIGSRCSFNVEFYKCSPQNALREQNRVDTPDGRKGTAKRAGSGKKRKPLKKFQCDPGICISGKCDANECFQALQTKTTSGYDSSFTGSSRGSQATTKRRQDKTRVLKSGKATFYKDTGVSSLPYAKKILHIPNRQAVRIGSTCSFNIEFYKCSPQNGLVTSQPDYQSVKSLPNKGKPRGMFECKPGVCIPGKCSPSECLKQFECNKVCVPGKCDPIDCMQRLRGTSTGTDGSYTGSSISTQSRKLKRGKLRAADRTLYKERGVSSVSRNKPTLTKRALNRQAVRIGSNCSFSIQFYKAISPPMMGDQNYPPVNFNKQDDNGKKRGTLKKYACVPGACIPGKCVPVECYNRIKQSQISGQSDSSDGRKSEKKRKTAIKYDCEPGVCIPGKCNAKECFQLFKAKHSIDNDGFLTDSSVATASQASTKRKSQIKRPELSAINTKFYTERGASSMPRSKTPLHLLNRQAVRIGSTCSFNMEFYKQIPANKRQHPFQYNIDDSRKYPAFPSSSETSGGKATGVICKCMHELIGDKKTPSGKKEKTTGKKETTTGKKETTIGKKETTTGKKETTIGKKETTTGKEETTTGKKETTTGKKNKTKQNKQPVGQHDQGDATLQEKSSSLPGGKSKGPKGKKAQEQGDATTKSKLSTGTQGQASRRKRTKRKQSQTRVSDQQSETSVDEKVGTDKLIDPVETPVQGNTQSKKTGKTSKIQTKYDQSDKEFEYELGVCIPNKCDPYLCFDRLRNRKEGTNTEGSLSTQSKPTGSTSKTTNVNLDRKVEAERRKIESSISPVYKNIGTSGIATNKNSQDTPQRIPPLGTPGNKKKVVRIGSSFSFNIKLFKDKPLTPAQVASIRRASTPPPSPLTGCFCGGFPKSSGLGGPKPPGGGGGCVGFCGGFPRSSGLGGSKPELHSLPDGGGGFPRSSDLGGPKPQLYSLPGSGGGFPGSSGLGGPKPELHSLSGGGGGFPRSSGLGDPKPEKEEEKLDFATNLKNWFCRMIPECAGLPSHGRQASQKWYCRMMGQPDFPECAGLQLHGRQTSQKWYCKMMGQPDFPECAGFQLHGSQTSQKCQCPGNLLRPAVQSCYANAATQSRRCPGLHQLSLNDDSLRSALCKCVAQLNPSRGTPGPRNVPYKSIVPGNWPFGPVPGYADDFNRYLVREKAVVIGSGCGFNVNFFKKRNLKKQHL